MNLTPLEIRKQEFDRAFRGLEPEQVQQFLSKVATEWESMLEAQRRLETQIEELRSKIEHYQKVEEALQEALDTARKGALRTKEQAKEKATLIVDQAELKAERLVEDADAKARAIVEEADRKRRTLEDTSRSTVDEVEDERRQLKKEVTRLFDHRSEMLSRLRGFLLSEMEVLARYEEDDPIGFIKLLPPESERTASRQASGEPAMAGQATDQVDRQDEDHGLDAESETTVADLTEEGENDDQSALDEETHAPWDSPIDIQDTQPENAESRLEEDFIGADEEPVTPEKHELDPEEDVLDVDEDAAASADNEIDLDIYRVPSDDAPALDEPVADDEPVSDELQYDQHPRQQPDDIDESEDSEEMKKIRRILRDIS